jgi:hypothetical protein
MGQWDEDLPALPEDQLVLGLAEMDYIDNHPR